MNESRLLAGKSRFEFTPNIDVERIDTIMAPCPGCRAVDSSRARVAKAPNDYFPSFGVALHQERVWTSCALVQMPSGV